MKINWRQGGNSGVLQRRRKSAKDELLDTGCDVVLDSELTNQTWKTFYTLPADTFVAKEYIFKN